MTGFNESWHDATPSDLSWNALGGLYLVFSLGKWNKDVRRREIGRV